MTRDDDPRAAFRRLVAAVLSDRSLPVVGVAVTVHVVLWVAKAMTGADPLPGVAHPLLGVYDVLIICVLVRDAARHLIR